MKKEVVQTINSFIENKYFSGCMFLVAILFVTFYSYSTSPLYVNEGYDSSVFKSMGLAITQGKVPYADFFDHKGPVLYFINALGQWLVPGRIGVFLLQLLATSISFIYLFKTARLFLNGVQSVCVMAVTLYIFGGLYQEGNQCEEWILAIVSPCLYLLLSDIVHSELKHISPLYGLLYGMCFGLAFFIRPNDALAIMGGSLLGAICYAGLIMKENKIMILYDILAFIGGFVLICIPIYVYFSYHHAFYDFIYGLFIHNSLYAKGVAGMLFSYRKVAYLLVWMILWYMIWNTEYRNVLFVVVPLCVFQYLMMGTRLFPHYMIDYIVLLLLCIVFLIRLNNVSYAFLCFSLMYVALYICRINILREAEDALRNGVKTILADDRRNRAFYTESDKLFNIVPLEKKDSIWNYNLTWRDDYPYSSTFFHHNITQCNKVPYYYMYYVSEKLKKADDIKMYAPPYIVLTHSNDEDTISQPSWANYNVDYKYIEAHYDLVAKTDSTVCDIELYRRKNKYVLN